MNYVERQKLTYVDYKCSRTVQYLCSYTIMMHSFLILVSITIAYTMIRMHDIIFSMNIAGVSHARCITFGAARLSPVHPTSGHLSCRDTFAWSRGCPFMTDTTILTLPSRHT